MSKDVILFCGQSNMQGQSERLTNMDEIEGAYEYRFLEDRIKPLSNPVGECIRYDGTEGYVCHKKEDIPVWLGDHVLGSATGGFTNLVPEFCRAYHQKCGREILAVHAAKGSTKIAEWLPGTSGYDFIVKKAKAAIRKLEETDQKGRVLLAWLQGESDAIAGNSTEYYKEKLCELLEALKKDVGVEKFGIIRVGRFTNDEKDEAIMLAQDEICRENSDFLMLTRIAIELNQIPEYMNPYVRGHYSATGLEKLGAAAGETLGQWRKENENNPKTYLSIERSE